MPCTYRIYSICAAGVLIKHFKYSAALRYYSRVRYYFILTSYYGLLHNIIANKLSQYIATYFSSKNFVLVRQLQYEHAGLARHTVSLLNNIRNFDRLLAV